MLELLLRYWEDGKSDRDLKAQVVSDETHPRCMWWCGGTQLQGKLLIRSLGLIPECLFPQNLLLYAHLWSLTLKCRCSDTAGRLRPPHTVRRLCSSLELCSVSFRRAGPDGSWLWKEHDWLLLPDTLFFYWLLSFKRQIWAMRITKSGIGDVYIMSYLCWIYMICILSRDDDESSSEHGTYHRRQKAVGTQ